MAVVNSEARIASKAQDWLLSPLNATIHPSWQRSSAYAVQLLFFSVHCLKASKLGLPPLRFPFSHVNNFKDICHPNPHLKH